MRPLTCPRPLLDCSLWEHLLRCNKGGLSGALIAHGLGGFLDQRFAAVHDKFPMAAVNEVAEEAANPTPPRDWKVRLPPRWTVVAASGVADDVDYVAAELPADGPRIFHEPDAAGVLPAEASEVEGRADRGVQSNAAEHAGREPGAARSRRSRDRRDRSLSRAAHPRPVPQADLQDRPGAEVDRRGHLRLMRG